MEWLQGLLALLVLFFLFIFPALDKWSKKKPPPSLKVSADSEQKKEILAPTIITQKSPHPSPITPSHSVNKKRISSPVDRISQGKPPLQVMVIYAEILNKPKALFLEEESGQKDSFDIV